MKKKLAIQIITEAINLAMTKGCFGLVENSNIVKALDAINAEPTFELLKEEEISNRN